MLCALCGASGCDDPTKPAAIWSTGGRGKGEVVYPRAIAYRPQSDTFFVVDRTARVQQLDRDGKFVTGWRMPLYENGKPVGLSVGPDGNVWVPDTHYHRVMVYTPAGELLRQFGERGGGPGQFEFPTDVAFDSAGLVYVAEYGGNDRVQVFTQAGEFVRTFGKFGKGPGEFSRPQGLAMRDDLLYVADACNHRVQVLTLQGEVVRTFGEVGGGPGQFRFPYGLDFDAAGNVVVCEYGGTRVQTLTPEGKPIASLGANGRLPGEFTYPWGVAVDKRGRLVVVDSGNNRFQVFEP